MKTGEKDTNVEWGVEAVTILCKLGGADQGGDLEVVLADGTVAQVLAAFSSGGVALFLQLQLRGR